jgi:Ca-activated chloride channel family protein
VASPITLANGVNPNEPRTALEVPQPKVLLKILQLWAQDRKDARVLLVMDVSGSMGDPAVGNGGDTKLDLAKRAAVSALDQFKSSDEVGLRIFTSDIDGQGHDYLDIVPIAQMGANKEAIRRKIGELQPLNGTPLYTTAQDSFTMMKADLAPTRINAIVLLTDGQNEDGNEADDDRQLDALVASGRSDSEGQATSPVRIFPIAYGSGADLDVLKRIAESTSATAYDASDPATIEKVFTNVISNF